MLEGRAVAADCGQRRPEDILMVIEERWRSSETVSGVNENRVGAAVVNWALAWAANCSATFSSGPVRRRTCRFPSR